MKAGVPRGTIALPAWRGPLWMGLLALWPVARVLQAAEEEQESELSVLVDKLGEFVISYGHFLLPIVFLVVVGVTMALYNKFFSSYLPKAAFKRPHLAVLAAIVIPLYGLTCAVFGVFALFGNPVAIEQLAGTGDMPSLYMAGGGIALAFLGALLFFGNRLACVLVTAILALDLASSLRGLLSGSISIKAVPVRVSMGAVVCMLAVWTWIEISARWRKLRTAQESVWRRSGAR